MQNRLRDDRSKVGPFIEEMLRIEGSVKATFRLARRTSTVGGVEIPAGKKVVVFLAGANHDPRQWQAPADFKLMRVGAMKHLAFGQGLHTCIGAPLARAETRIVLNRLLDKASGIELSKRHYGTGDKRDFDFEMSYVIRGLNTLYIAIKH
jgi:cytochrome P450